jgi:hypothetical protein
MGSYKLDYGALEDTHFMELSSFEQIIRGKWLLKSRVITIGPSSYNLTISPIEASDLKQFFAYFYEKH